MGFNQHLVAVNVIFIGNSGKSCCTGRITHSVQYFNRQFLVEVYLFFCPHGFCRNSEGIFSVLRLCGCRDSLFAIIDGFSGQRSRCQSSGRRRIGCSNRNLHLLFAEIAEGQEIDDLFTGRLLYGIYGYCFKFRRRFIFVDDNRSRTFISGVVSGDHYQPVRAVFFIPSCLAGVDGGFPTGLLGFGFLLFG